MLHKIKLLVLTLSIVFSGAMLAVPSLAGADALNSDACAGLNALQDGKADNTTCPAGSESQLNHLISIVVQILSWVLGIAATITVVLAGFKYITSGGDSGKIGSAKQTLIYALIGLVVAALAQVLIHFVLNTTTQTITPCSSAQPTLSKNSVDCKTPN